MTRAFRQRGLSGIEAATGPSLLPLIIRFGFQFEQHQIILSCQSFRSPQANALFIKLSILFVFSRNFVIPLGRPSLHEFRIETSVGSQCMIILSFLESYSSTKRLPSIEFATIKSSVPVREYCWLCSILS